MFYLSAVAFYISGIWAGVFLVCNDHPYFALLVFLMTGSLHFSSRSTLAKNRADDKELDDIYE